MNRLKGTLYDGESRLARSDGSTLAMYSMGGLAEYAVVPASDVADPVRDRDQDRVRDVPTDRPAEPVRDRVTDRERACDLAPESDRAHDCEPQRPEVRPILARCIDYIQSHTDRTIRRSLRWWWHVCHRLAWNHANPE